MKEANFSSKQERWQALIEEQRKSGLSAAEFCEARGLSKIRFYHQVAKLKAKGPKRGPKSKAPELVRVEVDRPHEPMRIVFQNGVALHFAEKPEAEWLVELMKLVA